MKKRVFLSAVLAAISLPVILLSGCSGNTANNGKIEIRMLQYKPEAVAAFEKMEQRFNETHDNIHLTIESPNEAMTVLKTRLIKTCK